MALISSCAKADEADLIGHFTPVIGVGDEEDTVAELIEWPRLKDSCVEHPTGSSRFREFYKAKSSIDGIWGHAFAYRARRVWIDNLLWVSGECLQRSDEEPQELNNRTIAKGINYKVLRNESFIDVVAREGTELEYVLKELEIGRFKRVSSKDDKVRRSQERRRLAGKTPGSMEEKSATLELNTPMKLARLSEIPNGPVDMATVSSTVVRNLAKRKDVKRGATPRSITSVSMDDNSKRKKDRSMELEKRISQLEGEKNQLEDNLTRERGALQLEREKEREAAALKLKEVRAESEAEAERLVTTFAISQNNLAGKFYQLRYTKAEIMAFSKGIYEEMEIIDEEEVKEREDGLNVAEKAVADNHETINQEIESSRLRVVDLEGLLEVEKKSSVKLQYEDRLDDNVKHSLKLDEAKRQVEDKIAIILSRDLALKQLTSELAELKEKAASGSWYEAELAEYHIRELNKEISDMKCNIHALNE
ncbi:hypothetical protein GIB67_034367 [Kingdonia uniflora]|uniref:Uncharacterized protein n=1 Tax=Kingdonia uniflora TaxID=39325 RepID=A0A7J7NS01_9MAGN|nr:hypothetical protein GIB67_034367 [Kingdonia uniflora]